MPTTVRIHSLPSNFIQMLPKITTSIPGYLLRAARDSDSEVYERQIKIGGVGGGVVSIFVLGNFCENLVICLLRNANGHVELG